MANTTSSKNNETTKTSSSNDDEKPICGLIMPISAMPPLYDTQHWSDVREVVEEAIFNADMRPQMVSDSLDSDVIQQRIIANIFNNPVVVCDVSGLNANVMFELGMRLASKKATIILTDDYASLPFDTKIIEHLGYPRGLALRETRSFIQSLTDRIIGAYTKVKNETYKPFLDNFTGVEAEVSAIKDVTDGEYVRIQLERIERRLAEVAGGSSRSISRDRFSTKNEIDRARALNPHYYPSPAIDLSKSKKGLLRFEFEIPKVSDSSVIDLLQNVSTMAGVVNVEPYLTGDKSYMVVDLDPTVADSVTARIRTLLKQGA